MRCAIFALAAGLMMIASTSVDACDKCAMHAQYAQGKSCSSCNGGVKQHGGGCRSCAPMSGIFELLRWRRDPRPCCGMNGGHGLGMHGHHGMPIGPGGPYTGPSGPPTATYGYPYYTIRGPRDFLMDNPPTIGR